MQPCYGRDLSECWWKRYWILIGLADSVDDMPRKPAFLSIVPLVLFVRRTIVGVRSRSFFSPAFYWLYLLDSYHLCVPLKTRFWDKERPSKKSGATMYQWFPGRYRGHENCRLLKYYFLGRVGQDTEFEHPTIATSLNFFFSPWTTWGYKIGSKYLGTPALSPKFSLFQIERQLVLLHKWVISPLTEPRPNRKCGTCVWRFCFLVFAVWVLHWWSNLASLAAVMLAAGTAVLCRRATPTIYKTVHVRNNENKEHARSSPGRRSNCILRHVALGVVHLIYRG